MTLLCLPVPSPPLTSPHYPSRNTLKAHSLFLEGPHHPIPRSDASLPPPLDALSLPPLSIPTSPLCCRHGEKKGNASVSPSQRSITGYEGYKSDVTAFRKVELMTCDQRHYAIPPSLPSLAIPPSIPLTRTHAHSTRYRIRASNSYDSKASERF